jgi:hypothetical protein
MRLVTVINPNFNPYPEGVRGPRAYPTMNDYYSLPVISTYGTFRVLDMLSADAKIALAELTNQMERTTRSSARKVSKRAVSA